MASSNLLELLAVKETVKHCSDNHCVKTNTSPYTTEQRTNIRPMPEDGQRIAVNIISIKVVFDAPPNSTIVQNNFFFNH